VFGVAVLSFWHVHAQDYASEAQEHPEAQITAAWDEDRGRGRREASRRGVPFHEHLDELLSREDVDGVVVTTPTVAHREVITAASRAGKHVFAEKVIAPTLREAREVVAEVEEAGVTFVVSLPRLFAGYTQAIREALDFVAGMQVWTFADFAAVQSVMRVGGMNMKGVFTRARQPRMAAHVLHEFWAERADTVHDRDKEGQAHA
jgi:Oxidoreductase family, NAD-binding Rossmann fold